MESNQFPSNLPPSVLVIFGITGNLSQIKLLPAVYELLKNDILPERFSIVGIFREGSADLDKVMQQTEINLLRSKKECDQKILSRLKSLITPVMMDSTNPDHYHLLRETLDALDEQHQLKHQRLFYLAIPPNIFMNVISCLSQAGLNTEQDGVARRIFVEKPFGVNLSAAKELVEHMGQHFSEQQIYRIDHYLAKETAQNILAFRFANPIIEDIWGRQFIDHIQISALQKIDIEGRAAFYEGMGALRDIIQSHLLQLMALILMEVPERMDSETIHTEKLALLQAVETIKQNHVDEVAVRGQYDGYRYEVKNDQSNTETYAAIKLEVANSRWGGVPILLRTGKALGETATVIHVVFKDRSRRSLPANILTIRIQPNEGIALHMTAKKPGFTNDLQPVDMDFSYQRSFEEYQPDAYERVLVDAIAGDQSLFATSQEVIRSWEILEPVLEEWQYLNTQPTVYSKGAWGPQDADALAASYGSAWINNASSPHASLDKSQA